jgi:uncharacterized protein (DUF433 family)
MPTFLLTWNPEKWNWGDFVAEARILKRGGQFSGYWSCGNSTSIKKGARVFLIKQGHEPRGIVAAGWVTSEKPYDGEHWDKTRRDAGKPARYVDIDFEAVLDPTKEEILGREQLTEGPLADVHWGAQMGGIRIPEPAAKLLELRWRAHLARRGKAARSSPGLSHRSAPDVVRDGPGADSARMAADAREAALLQRITLNPRIFSGKPIIRGRRLAVEHVLGLLAAGDTPDDILANYPWMEPDDVKACLVYARRVVGQERIEPLHIEIGR